MNEAQFEKRLNIHTAGFQYGFPKDAHYHRYEPTPYEGLEQLFEHYTLPEKSSVVDIGCGKGRVPIYLHDKFNIPTVGIEMDIKFYVEAENNKQLYAKKIGRKNVPIQFLHELGEQYHIAHANNVFFFFNPFSLVIFRKVIMNILKSYEVQPRRIDIILYYPAHDYLDYLQYETPFEQLIEIALEGERNVNERIIVFSLNVNK